MEKMIYPYQYKESKTSIHAKCYTSKFIIKYISGITPLARKTKEYCMHHQVRKLNFRDNKEKMHISSNKKSMISQTNVAAILAILKRWTTFSMFRITKFLKLIIMKTKTILSIAICRMSWEYADQTAGQSCTQRIRVLNSKKRL